jgi:hypothetical protein
MLSGLLLCLTALLIPQQDAKVEFQKRFNQALKVNDRVAMDRSISKYKVKALEVFLDRAETTKWGHPWLEEFSNSWKRVHRSEFPSIYSQYISSLDAATEERRSKAIFRLIPLFQLNADATSSRKGEDWQKLVEILEPGGLMLEFMELDDKYYLATCNSFLVNCYNKEYRDEGGDLFQAFKAAESFTKLRDELQYKNDPTYSNVRKILINLRAELGIEDPDGKAERVAKESPFTIHDVEGEDWVDVPLRFFIEKKPGKIQHPSDIADSDRINWRYMGVSKEGDKAVVLPAYGGEDVLFGGPRGQVFLSRIKANKFQIEAGADPSEEFSLALKPKLIQFDQKLSDGTTIPQALWVAGGSEADMLQGQQVNSGLNPDGGLMFFRNAAARSGKTPFGDLTLYDYDGDGSFGRLPVRVAGSVAMPSGKYYNRFDSITLGGMKIALPFSRWVTDRKGSWFELEWEPVGNLEKVRIKKVAPTLAPLTVSFKGPKGLKLVSMVLRSETSKTKGLYLDVTGKGPHQLPIGRYQVVQGLMRGKDDVECIIQPPSDIPFTIMIEKGEENRLDFGGPFKLYADPVVADGNVGIDRESLKVVGIAGESYMMPLGAPLRGIEVQIKGGKSFELVDADAEAIAKDWHEAYFPVSGTAPVPKSGKVEIKLSLKKHPWFGKLSSDWIEE